MKASLIKYSLFLVFFFPHFVLVARADSSKTLQLIEFEEMRDLLNTHIAKSQTYLSDEGEDADSALEELKKALTLLLMKPSANEPQTPLLRLIQNEVIKYRSFLSVLRECVQTAISDFQAGANSPQQQANQIYILENAISYLQSVNNEESNAILKDIRAAKLKISDKLSGYLLMEMGRGKIASPSRLAGQILQPRLDKLKKEKKAQAKKRGLSSKESKTTKQKSRPKTIEINL